MWLVIIGVNLWPDIGTRICAWPAKNLLRYVREHDICEISNGGIASLARKPSFGAPYAVWFVVIVVVLMVFNIAHTVFRPT